MSDRPQRFLAVLLLSCLSAGALRAAEPVSTYLPLGHRAYDALERWEAKGLLPRLADGTRPLSRLDVARALDRVWGARDREPGLSSVERAELVWLADEFAIELEALDAGLKGKRPDRERGLRGLLGGGPLARWERSDATLELDLIAKGGTIVERGDLRETTHVTTSGGIARGTLRETFAFYSRFRETREQGTKFYNTPDVLSTRRVGFVKLRDDFADYDEGLAYILVRLRWFLIEFGRDALQWGPGARGGLILSPSAPPFTMVKLETHYGRLKYIALGGVLRTEELDSLKVYQVGPLLRKEFRKKAIAAHRLEVAATDWLDVAASEVVIYGDRGLDMAYFNPAIVLRAAERDQGDRDNATAALDLEARLPRRIKMYGALFIDDLTKSKVGTSFFGNKLAWLGGALWVDPWRLVNTDLRFEYARLDPFVYTHTFGVNAFTNWRASLGHWLDPNSDEWYLEARHRPHRSLRVELALWGRRHGANPPGANFGGDLRLGSSVQAGAGGEFLAGELERETALRTRVVYEPIRDLLAVFDYRHRRLRNVLGKEPSGPRGDELRHEFRFTIGYNDF